MIADSALDEWQRENPDPVIASTIRMRREFTITGPDTARCSGTADDFRQAAEILKAAAS